MMLTMGDEVWRNEVADAVQVAPTGTEEAQMERSAEIRREVGKVKGDVSSDSRSDHVLLQQALRMDGVDDDVRLDSMSEDDLLEQLKTRNRAREERVRKDARPFLGAKADELGEIELMKETIREGRTDMNLDDKSVHYLRGRFQARVHGFDTEPRTRSGARSDSHVCSSCGGAGGSGGADDDATGEQAREDAYENLPAGKRAKVDFKERSREAWRKPLAASTQRTDGPERSDGATPRERMTNFHREQWKHPTSFTKSSDQVSIDYQRNPLSSDHSQQRTDGGEGRVARAKREARERDHNAAKQPLSFSKQGQGQGNQGS